MTDSPNHVGVTAVIASYHPDAELLQHLQVLLPQVGHVVIVDDGSDPDATDETLQAAERTGVTVVRLPENGGIAHSLNTGIRHAIDTWNAEFILTLDQDSELPKDYVEKSLQTASRLQHAGARVGQIAAASMNGAPMPVYQRTSLHDIPFDPLQSGSLFPAAVFSEVGTFRDDFIIDSVDVEFTLRLLSRGLHVSIGNGCNIVHSLGAPMPLMIFGKQRSILGKPRQLLGTHRPFRTYYMIRNRFVLRSLYRKRFPRWIARSTYRQVRSTLFSILVGPSRRKQFIAAMAGVHDARRRRMGKMDTRLAHRISG